MMQNATEFKPSANQEKWLHTALNLDTDEISKIAQECNVHRVQWYRWCKNPKFTDWFNKSWNLAIKCQAWKLDAIGMQMAKKNFKYWESMRKRVGRNLEDKAEKEIKSTREQIEELPEEEVDEIIARANATKSLSR